MARRDPAGGPDTTVRAAKKSLSVVSEPRVRLVVTRGPNAGTTFVIDGTQAPRVLVGTSPACDFVLADRQVSRRHLALELADSRIDARDLGSTNGSKVNGVAIREVFLHGGETLEIGETAITVAFDDEEGEPLVSDEMSFGRYLGQSVTMRRLYPLCHRLAAASVPLVIEGDTGTGKELLAEALHESGPRAAGPFVVFDCAAVPASETEAVLFGREDGSGAVRQGLFEEANGGTLLVDAIAELDLAVQAKLLGAIDRREIRRVSGGRAVPIDVRIIATSRRDLDREVAAGRFRDDLFFRVAVTRIELPALVKRPEDIELLAAHFWSVAAGQPDAGHAAVLPDALASALARMGSYDWPGNVRELEGFVARVCALGDAALPPRAANANANVAPAERVLPGDFIGAVVAEHLPLTSARDKVVEEFERRYVEDAFVRNGRNVTKAAAAAGIARRYFRALRARQRD